MASQSIQFPFPYNDPNNIPIEWEAEKPIALKNDQIPELIQGIANFYACFLSPTYSRNSRKIFHDTPEKFPSAERVDLFKKKLIQLITADCETSMKTDGIWRGLFSTHYCPEELLGKACEELEEEFHHKVGIFFPSKSWLRIKLQGEQLSVSWRGKGSW